MTLFQKPGGDVPACPLVVVLDKDDVLHVTRAHFNFMLAPLFTQYLGIPKHRAEQAVDDAYVAHGEVINYLMARSPQLHVLWESVDERRKVLEACNARVMAHLKPDPELNDLLARLVNKGVVLAVLSHNYTAHSREALTLLEIDRYVRPDLIVGRNCLAGRSKLDGTAYPFLDERLPVGPPRVVADDQYRNLLALPVNWSGRMIGLDPLPAESTLVRYARVHDFLTYTCEELGA